MRHRVTSRKLNRTASHRTALLRNLAASLLLHKRIKTTLAKAKELRSFVEPLITKARKGTLTDKRTVMDTLRHKEAAKTLFNDIVTMVGDRPGGYTRVIKAGFRLGDAAAMAIIELVDYNEVANESASQKEEIKAEVKKQQEAAAKEKVKAEA
ncbi:MAG: 50S ribosomal protein L17 [Ignavibacteriaceae bacterium]|nr:50S ribosomal protein L17 [Ignavibacteriaceae bacterium]